MHTDDAKANQAITPTRQEVVPLFDKSIVAVSLPDGRIAATLASLCDALGLTQNSQVRRIRMDDVLADALVSVAIETSSGIQAMVTLTAWAIPLWLTGIQIRKVAEEKRPAILAFKKQAANVLYEHFSRLTLPSPVTLVPSEPIEKPSYPGTTAGPDERRKYHLDMVAWLDWQDDIRAWQSDTNNRLDGLESEVESLHEVVRLVPELLERMGPATLSSEHMSSVQAMAKRLHDVGGFSFATIYGELNSAFHVGRYDQIADALGTRLRTGLPRASARRSDADAEGVIRKKGEAPPLPWRACRAIPQCRPMDFAEQPRQQLRPAMHFEFLVQAP